MHDADVIAAGDAWEGDTRFSACLQATRAHASCTHLRTTGRRLRRSARVRRGITKLYGQRSAGSGATVLLRRQRCRYAQQERVNEQQSDHHPHEPQPPAYHLGVSQFTRRNLVASRLQLPSSLLPPIRWKKQQGRGASATAARPDKGEGIAAYQFTAAEGRSPRPGSSPYAPRGRPDPTLATLR